MQYENRQPRQHINVPHEHPLKRFGVLLLAAAILVVATVFILQFAGGRLAALLPFRYEQRLMQRLDIDFAGRDTVAPMQSYLQRLAGRLAPYMNIPEGMIMKMHHNGDSVVNAFATVGGNVVFYSGLLERLPHENALAMVVAHEMAHVLHRDPAVGVGGSMVSMLALSMVTGHSGTGSAARLLNWSGSVTSVQFTRGMESSADRAALEAVYGLYGHVNGAEELFMAMQGPKAESSALPNMDSLTSFTRTHPSNSDRVSSVAELAAKSGWPVEGKTTPLPARYHDWLQGK